MSGAALAPTLSAAWGGFLLAIALAAITIKQDPRYPLFLLAGLAHVIWPLVAAARAALKASAHD